MPVIQLNKDQASLLDDLRRGMYHPPRAHGFTSEQLKQRKDTISDMLLNNHSPSYIVTKVRTSYGTVNAIRTELVQKGVLK